MPTESLYSNVIVFSHPFRSATLLILQLSAAGTAKPKFVCTALKG